MAIISQGQNRYQKILPLKDKGPDKKRKHWFRRALLFLILLFPVLAISMQYFRIQGFKETLASLVESNTNGNYELSIGETDIQFTKLSFSLKDMVVSKIDPSDSTGILEVKSQQLTVRIGSLFSMLSSEQFKIEEFSIIEPVAVVGLKQKQQKRTPEAPLNIAHEIAQFYPAIESILNQFEIKLFHIDRAEIGLHQSQTQVEIRLLDILVSDWNMRNLSKVAKFRWSLGPQSIDFSSSEFSFKSIVYDFQENELDLQGYTFVQRDSLDRTVIDIQGKSLRVINLDYEALITDEHYIFEQLSISEPDVIVHVYPHKKKERSIKYPISNLLKRNFKELHIKKFNLVDARMDLFVYGALDTLNVLLPKMDLETRDIVVTEDSSTLMVGALNLELDRTRFDPGGPLSLEFSKLIYDEDYNIEIDSIELFDKATGVELMACEYLELFNFDFFHYYFENQVNADSLLLRNGKLNTNHGAPRLKPSIKKKTIGGKRKEPPTMHIGKVKFDEIDLNLDLGAQQIQAQKIIAIIDGLNREHKTSYQIRYLGSPSLIYHDPVKNIEVNLGDIYYDQNAFKIGSLDGRYHGLDLSVDTFSAALKANFDLDEPWHNQLNSIELAEIKLTGSLPAPEKKEKKPLPDLIFQKIRLDQFQLDVNLANGHRLIASGGDLLMDSAQFVDNKIALNQAMMNLDSVSFKSDHLSYYINQAAINSDSISVIVDLQISPDSSKTIIAEKIEIGAWKKNFTEITMDHLLVSQLEYLQTGAQTKSTIDSIKFNNIYWKEKEEPFADQVDIHGPDLYFTSNKGANASKNKGINIKPLRLFGEIHIDPGQVTIDDRKVSFKQVSLYGKGEEKDVELKEVSFVTPSASFHIKHVWTTVSNLNIDTITIVPVEEFVKQIDIESDVVAGQIYSVQIRDIDWKALIDSNKIAAAEILLDGFDISIRRDKTLPDPVPITKPHLLTDMIPLIPNVYIPKITTRNGNISYHEVGESTGREGKINLTDINLTINRYPSPSNEDQVLTATAKLYDQGQIQVNYDQLDSGKFALNLRLVDFPLELLNQMVDPLEAAKIESGHLVNYEFEVIADSAQAIGQAMITYDDLHVRIFKKDSPDEHSIGADLLTVLINSIILKHSKEDAIADLNKERITYKGPLNYWIKIAVQGAGSTIMKGKKKKSSKRRKSSG